MKQYDYIIAGAGCAGLSLLVRLLRSGHFSQHKILLIDRQQKAGNDRTWCFWEKGRGYFDELVCKRWDQLRFYHPTYDTQAGIAPYAYKMIRSIDFYQYCFSIVHKYPNVDLCYETVTDIDNTSSGALVRTGRAAYQAAHVFNSIQLRQPVLSTRQYYLLQHFKGWFIKTGQPVFDPAVATLMDFRVAQERGTAFAYVMPFTPTEALVEYTLFSPERLLREEYDAGLRDYLHRVLKIDDYTVWEEEGGAIPMTNYRFPRSNGPISWLGTAGGQTKASSGYTFQFIQKQSEQLVQAMLGGQPLHRKSFTGRRSRFDWYDATLLNVLVHQKLPGDRLFRDLFRNNKITAILQFLDNETDLLQELKIFNALPKRTFLRAAWQQLF